MPTPPLIDFDALLAPIPGPDPAGKPVPFAIREQFEASRKEVDPSNFAKGDPLRPAEALRADWPLIERLASETLQRTSKDLLTAARLTEALTRRHGFDGLRDGLGLLRRLVETCWDRLIPPIEEEEDVEVRAAAFFWLDDPDRGARFPVSLRGVPILVGPEDSYSWREWKAATAPPKDEDDEQAAEVRQRDFEAAFQATPREACQQVSDDLKGAGQELDALGVALDAAMGRQAPGLVSLRDAISSCALLADQLLSRKGPAPASASAPIAAVPEVDEPGDSGAAEASAAAGPSRARPAGTNRADIYRQIGEAAAALKVLEPHSPIPYLLHRAVELGALPFPELMKVLVRNPEALELMSRELGIKEILDAGG